MAASGGDRVIRFILDGKPVELAVDDGVTLRQVFREELGVQHILYGCGVGMCGSCTLYVDDIPVRTCVLPAYKVHDRKVNTTRGPGGTRRSVQGNAPFDWRSYATTPGPGRKQS